MEFMKIMKDISWIGQLGLSLIMPLLLCLGGCWLAVNRWGFPGWFFIVAIVLGLGGGMATAVGFYKITMKRSEESPPPASNEHR